jgi:hypothetical protein
MILYWTLRNEQHHVDMTEVIARAKTLDIKNVYLGTKMAYLRINQEAVRLHSDDQSKA